jgi:hypothetical protein
MSATAWNQTGNIINRVIGTDYTDVNQPIIWQSSKMLKTTHSCIILVKTGSIRCSDFWEKVIEMWEAKGCRQQWM